jgi:hypothetical protein
MRLVFLLLFLLRRLALALTIVYSADYPWF